MRDGKFFTLSPTCSERLPCPSATRPPRLVEGQGPRSRRGVELRDNNQKILSPINLSTFPQTKLSNGLDVAKKVNPVLSKTLHCAIIAQNRSVRQGPRSEILIFCYDFVIIMMTMILWN